MPLNNRAPLGGVPPTLQVGAASTLVGFLDHEAKQCRLNATAALYAISCGGRQVVTPLPRLLAAARPTLWVVCLS